MRPQGKRDDGGRAAMYLASLRWLDGFPIENGWHVLGSMEPIAIDGARIAKSRRVGNTLRREHRDELAERVGDVDRWWRAIDAKLAWCAAPARPLDLIDMMPARSARAARTQATAAVHAAAIAWAAKPAVLTRAVAWLVARPHVEATHGVVLAIELAAMAEVGGEVGVDCVLALLEVDAPDPKLAVERLANIVAHVNTKPGHNRRAEAPVPAMSSLEVMAWVRTLIARAPEVQQRAMAVVAVADLAGALRPWQTWWEASEAALARASSYVPRSGEDAWKNQVGLLGRLAAVKKAAPIGAISIEGVLIDVLLLAGDAAHATAAVRLIAGEPASTPVAKARLVTHCARTAATADDARAAWLWDAIADELDRGASTKLYAMWWPAISSGNWVHLESDVFRGTGSRAEIRRWAAIVARLTSPSKPAALTAAMWMQAGLPDDRIAATVDADKLDRWGYPVELARAAIALADGTPGDLVAVLDDLSAIAHDGKAGDLRGVCEHAAASGATWLVRVMLASRRDAVGELGRVAAIVPRSTWPAFGDTSSKRAWIVRYPVALAPALRRLASVRRDAETAAQRRLATDFPDPVALDREIATLRARSSLSASQTKRLANLEARLAAPRMPSSRRLGRLGAAIDHLAASTGFDRFAAAMTTAATERIVRTFGLANGPSVHLDRTTAEIFAALARLPERDRALAGRLLRARSGPRPWDLRDEPANRAFVDRLRAKGMMMEPWLDDSPVRVRAGDGVDVEIAFTDDPLEVFAMGLHFETCLSPGAMNFFSTVTNAADINKRVLYARRAGAIVGRCLFALTDSGSILVFHAYAHQHALRFHEIVRDFATSLAARMGTVVVPTGKVSLVIAGDWYDDGPRDLVGRFSKLNELDLDDVSLTAVVPALRGALGHELDDLTLPHVIRHRGVVGRPELVIQLAPYLLRTPPDPQTMVAAATLAWRAGDRDLADRLLGDRGDHVDLDRLYTGAVLALLRPSFALARLREQRARPSRSWRTDSPDRQAIAAIALAVLHRPRQSAVIATVVRESHEAIARELDYWLE